MASCELNAYWLFLPLKKEVDTTIDSSSRTRAGLFLPLKKEVDTTVDKSIVLTDELFLPLKKEVDTTDCLFSSHFMGVS